jgi:hypothetical protein
LSVSKNIDDSLAEKKTPDKHNISADTSNDALIKRKTMFNPKPKAKVLEESKKEAFDLTKDEFFNK